MEQITGDSSDNRQESTSGLPLVESSKRRGGADAVSQEGEAIHPFPDA